MRSSTPIGPGAWLLWFLAAGAVPLTGRHPYHLALVLLVVMIVHLTIPERDGAGRSWRLFAYVGSSVSVLSIGFNVLTVHTGDEPFADLPGGLPIIGGQLTYNALVYGVSSAIAISSLLFAAATFNTAVRHAELIRRIPRPFQQLGVAGAIALNYVPQTMQAARDIYDAQRARGRSMRGVGDARAFLVPLLGNGLERAFQMSEAMETRGYGRQHEEAGRTLLDRLRAPLAIGLAILSLPLVATGRLLEGLILAMAAALAVGLSASERSLRQRIAGWSRSSVAVAAPAILALVMIAYRMATGDTLEYTPFPRLEWPEFDLLIGLASCLLLAPAFVVSGGPDD